MPWSFGTAAKLKPGPPNRAKGFERHFRKSAFEPATVWDLRRLERNTGAADASKPSPRKALSISRMASPKRLADTPKSQILKDSRLSLWHFTHSGILISLGSTQPLALVTIQCLCKSNENNWTGLLSRNLLARHLVHSTLKLQNFPSSLGILQYPCHGSFLIPANSNSVIPIISVAPSVLRTSAIGVACCSKPGVAAACSSGQEEKNGNAERKYCNIYNNNETVYETVIFYSGPLWPRPSFTWRCLWLSRYGQVRCW